MADLKILEALEDLIDIKAAKRALQEPENITWKAIKKQSGLNA
ncbi:hypothetical protein ACQZV8_15840 [Magnetococcales bacterium HHB-1]